MPVAICSSLLRVRFPIAAPLQHAAPLLLPCLWAGRRGRLYSSGGAAQRNLSLRRNTEAAKAKENFPLHGAHVGEEGLFRGSERQRKLRGETARKGAPSFLRIATRGPWHQIGGGVSLISPSGLIAASNGLGTFHAGLGRGWAAR
jgi:hypothetical protein